MQTLKKDIKQKILDAGRREFSRKGFAKASMRTIAMQVGVGVGNLYNYFPSKDRLFCAVLAPVISAFESMFERHHGNYADAMEMIREEYLYFAVSEYMNLLRGNRTLMKILFFGAQGSSLEHFKAEFTDRATEQVKMWFMNNKERHPQMNIKVSDFMIHLHTVWMFTMFEEILMHKISVEEMPRIVEEYIKFEINGWKHILQL
ncbi:MAG: TetR/AcrR family transcriptional regulator [Prevotella sp.]|nr:TetR/AcrR family transcriptional regulator [Prevotella sp.]MDO4934051.1 TetR/AcrR family transcriptional regulator [Prevotella sp.]